MGAPQKTYNCHAKHQTLSEIFFSQLAGCGSSNLTDQRFSQNVTMIEPVIVKHSCTRLRTIELGTFQRKNSYCITNTLEDALEKQ